MLRRFTRKKIVCLGFLLCAVLTHHTDVTANTIMDFYVPTHFTFEQDLYKDKRVSPDVIYLQNILNVSTSTRVAEKGPGSNKNLSSYYGSKTQDAVDRFQKLYAKEIYQEMNISTSTLSTGVQIRSSTLDVFTRRVLNKLIIIYNKEKQAYVDSIYKKATTTQASQYQHNQSQSDGSVDAMVDAMVKDVVGVTTGVAVAAAATAEKASSGILNFGGVSTSMVTCTCSGNLLIYVQDVRGPVLPLIYQPGATILYKMYQPRSGVNMLGQFIGGGVCMVYAGTGCVTGGTPVGTMIQLGTSMTIAPGL